jgi:hypothetical protein
MMKGVASIDSTMAARMGLKSCGGTSAVLAGERQQHQAELARLGKVETDAQGDAHRGAQGPCQAGDQRQLEQPATA